MKIAFVGKGGSGKTTVASLFARYVAAKGHHTVAIDADINQHLATALGMTDEEHATLPFLAAHERAIKEYLRGNNERIAKTEQFMKTTPPGNGSRFLSPKTAPGPLSDLWRKVNEVHVLKTGPLEEKDIGMSCYHGKTMIVEIILNHLLDSKDEYVIVDMTAGADSFASGMFTKFDITFLIVEPTQKSLDVYHQFKQQSQGYEVDLRVIGNKVEDEEDSAFLNANIGADLLGTLSRSAFVKKADRGLVLPIEELELVNATTLEQMREEVTRKPKNWDQFYRQTVNFHIKNADGWMSKRAGVDLKEQIDPDFVLSENLHQ